MTEFNKICVLGLGYVGLPTAAIFASRGVQVIGVDINEMTVETINQGKIHIVEPGLDIMVNGAVSTGKLVADPLPQPADAYIIAVPTPFKNANKPDLSFVEAAARSIHGGRSGFRRGYSACYECLRCQQRIASRPGDCGGDADRHDVQVARGCVVRRFQYDHETDI